MSTTEKKKATEKIIETEENADNYEFFRNPFPHNKFKTLPI